MRALVVIALAACLIGCGREQAAAPPPTSAPAPASAQETGDAGLTAEGWGPLRIGMTMDEITAALGPDANPDAVGGPDPESCNQFRPERAPEGMLLMVENGELTRISLTHGSQIKTDRGFGLGDTAAAIKAAYGGGAVSNPHHYLGLPAEYIAAWTNVRPAPGEYVRDANARGIVYETNLEGVVEDIHAGGPSIQYVEGCA
ncbi:MAG TPA: hypothetical protein VEA80_02570 [Vitreimonas sp.]|uniref:hypothetical protein n=1 Tax=Vitreimonas sp. TaxID=3069702 RepID=UPI002D33CA95|nr:hypothetical protein [Vitreimonas sp.]HYD86335.1 hypothetical protein [Vitreimonas sp.]